MDLSHLVQALPNFLIEHKGVIYLLSAIVSLLFALVIFSLLRRFRVLKEDEWVSPFAWAFAVLAVMYLLRCLLWLIADHLRLALPPYVAPSIVASVALCSALSSYFFFRVGLPLTDKKRRIGHELVETLHLKPGVARYAGLAVLFAAALLSIRETWWARIPDVFFSASALVFVGVALYRNTSFRRDPFMAWLALLTASFYAVAHLAYGVHPWVAQAGLGDWIVGSQGDIQKKIDRLDVIVFSVALLFKVGLFFPGHALMLVIAAPTESVKRLLKGVTDGSAEFLESNGIVRSIAEEMHASEVVVYVKVPGTERNKVASYKYSSTKGWSTEHPEETSFDNDSDYGFVMSTGQDIRFRLTNYQDNCPDAVKRNLSGRSSLIVVPILFHNAVIGCLKAQLTAGRFTEADMQNAQRFASLLSTAVQDYREVDALNQISHRLTRLQIEAAGYDIERAADGIARIAHDILAPLATGVSIEAGFRCYRAVRAETEHHASMMQQQLNRPFSETIRTSGSENVRWLPKRLKVASIDLEEGEGQDGEHLFGTLILTTYAKWDRTKPPTLATNFFHRRVVSNLITEALLNFTRGYLGEVTKKLGLSLSASTKASASDWLSTVEEKAIGAHLLWAVATQADSDELLGKETDLVRRLEEHGQWVRKETRDDDSSNLEMWLCKLEPSEGNTSHVIRLSLRDTAQTLWLGVGNSRFDVELDYLSPWAAFILRFGEVADTALRRILNKHERERSEKEAADFHGLATTAIATGTVIHQMVNQVRDLTGPITTLEEAIKLGTLKGNNNHKRLILSLKDSTSQIQELTKLFSGVTKPDDRRPCSLDEAVQYAINLLRDSFTRYSINIDAPISSSYVVDVPFYVAAFALANLLNNAKDAIRDGKVNDGVIQVRAEDMEADKMIFCHVSDNGPGVPSRFVGQLFESGGKSDKPHGSGLGLYLSARSLREARGNIKLTHPGPNPRTTFTICFPKRRLD